MLLLRSASTPILKSLNFAPVAGKEACREAMLLLANPSLLTRATSENRTNPPLLSVSLEEEKKPKRLHSSLNNNLKDGGGCKCKARAENVLGVEDEGCAGDGSCNRRIGGGNSGGGSSHPCDGGSGDDSTDAYYRNMIQANPENSLVLGNYARFLKEVRGDIDKAQEYCERAIMADQKDGDVLSMYAEILWEKNRDADRAETYFDQAIQAAPNDCYVLGSYARFLWESEEDRADEESKNDLMDGSSLKRDSPVLFSRAAPPSVAAAS